MKGSSSAIRGSSGDRVLQALLYLFMAVSGFLVVYPLWFIVTASVSEPGAVLRGENLLWPSGFQLEGYQRIFRNGTVFRGYANSAIYAVLGAVASMVTILPFAFALARPSFRLRRLFTILLVVPMYFSGGLIPQFLVMRGLGLYDTRLLIVLMGCFGAWNVFIARTFFMSTIPEELYEANVVEGGDYFQYFFSIVLPLSGAIVAVIGLFAGVGQWNDFFKGLIYLNDRDKWPLQLILRDIVTQAESSEAADMLFAESVEERTRVAGIIKYGMIVAASAPVLVIYPFLQKYFIRGVMLGAVKG
jgi:putative aldouronate transport system permease protein